MNELQEFFSSVAEERVRVQKEKERFEPRVNVNLSDLSGFFGTITEAKREHVVIAKRDSTKLDALKGFFDRLDKFETALNENIDKQKEIDYEDEVKYDVETPAKDITLFDEEEIKEEDKSESEKSQEELEPIDENI